MGSRVSAGLEKEFRIRLGISLKGARAVDWAAVKRKSQMALWCVILSILIASMPDLVVSKWVSCAVAFWAGVG